MALPHKKIKVLIVDDSAVVRQAMSATSGADPEIEVIGVANDPLYRRRRRSWATTATKSREE